MTKKKPKLTRAQVAAQAEEAFRKMNERWDKVPKFAGKYVKPEVVVTKKRVGSKPTPEEIAAADAAIDAFTSNPNTAEIPTKKTKFVVGVGAKLPDKEYTGTEMLGVSIMHKSSLVPVFSKESAIDIAKMRRG